VQKGKDFQTRLQDTRTTGIWSLMKHRKPGGTGVFTIGMPAIKTAAKGRR